MTLVGKYLQFSFYFLLLISMTSLDMWFDFKHGVPARHLIFEMIILFIGMLGFNYFSSLWFAKYKKQSLQISDLSKVLNDRDSQIKTLNKKIKSYKEEFRREIEETFRKWNLTASETEVAGLLLKGLSIKEIADLRGSNERTVRSQCTSIYKKSKLENRSQLSSYFLDDLV